MTDKQAPSWLQRLKERIFPPVTDFYQLLNQQCDLVEQGMAALAQYMASGDEQAALRVKTLEHQGDKAKQLNLDALHQAFATPMDREDIYRAIAAIDDILNYAKTTVKEMELLQIKPDEHTLEMAKLMHQGARALKHGFAQLEKQPLAAEADAVEAHKTERMTEKVYRKALAELFDPAHYLQTQTTEQRRDAEALAVLMPTLADEQNQAITPGVGFVLEILKRREIYRHMSNGADRVAFASEVLHDIIAKVA